MVTNDSISFQGFSELKQSFNCGVEDLGLFSKHFLTSGIQIEFPLAQIALWLKHTKGKLDRSGIKMPNIFTNSISLKNEYFDFIVLANWDFKNV